MAELAVIGVSTADQIEIDAAAAALRGAKLGQSPISRLVIGVVIGPRGRSGEPAGFSETARQQGVAHQPTAIDADAVAGSRQSGVDLAEIAHDIGQLFPWAVHAEIYRAASRLRVLLGELDRSFGVLASPPHGERGELVVVVLKNDCGFKTIQHDEIALAASQGLPGQGFILVVVVPDDRLDADRSHVVEEALAHRGG